MTKEEQLASVRRRIAAIRSLLEDTTLLTNVSISGLSESVDRTALRKELAELEDEEKRLTGHGGRIFRIKFGDQP